MVSSSIRFGRRREQPSSTSTEKQEDDQLPDWFHSAKSFKIFEYDTTRYPFRELMAAWLNVPVQSLIELHTLSHIPTSNSPIHPKLSQAWQSAKQQPPLSTAARQNDGATRKQFHCHSKEYKAFMDCYRLFMKEFVVPLIYESCCDGESNNQNTNTIYQSPPTTRVVLPNGQPTIRIHTDSEYKGHQNSEINFWIPLTQVSGTNSLYLESKPGAGDFTPISMEYGQALRFDGYSCRHYTVTNTTNSSRVSFDFRVVPSSLWPKGEPYVCGDYAVEETTSNTSYISYPHTSWRFTRGVEFVNGKEQELEPAETPLPAKSTLTT